jgi:ribonuclease inhibitor
MPTQTSIDLAKVDPIEKLHARLKRSLHLPDYYGANLDALYDVLTEGGEERTLVFRNAADFWHRFPDFTPRLVQMLLNARDETEGLDIIFHP